MAVETSRGSVDLFVVAWALFWGGIISLLTVIFAGAAVILLPASLVVGIVALARNLASSAKERPSESDSFSLSGAARKH